MAVKEPRRGGQESSDDEGRGRTKRPSRVRATSEARPFVKGKEKKENFFLKKWITV